MKRYEFYRNQKITVIDCRYFSFEAENLETAVQKIKELCADGQLDELSNDPTYQEDAAYQIPGTEYPLDIENNNGDPTVMIYSAADGNCITDNPCWLRRQSASPSERNTIFRFTNIRSSLISGHRMGRYA